MSYLLSDPVMLLLGLLTHYMMILTEMSAARKEVVRPWTYLRERPYKAILSAIGAIVAYSLIQDTSAEPYIVFGAGYMANDALDRLGTITNKSMTRTIVVNEQGQPVKERMNDETIITYAESEALSRPSELRREMHGD